jgi:hypothetical protein
VGNERHIARYEVYVGNNLNVQEHLNNLKGRRKGTVDLIKKEIFVNSKQYNLNRLE